MNSKLKRAIFSIFAVFIVYNFWRALFPVIELEDQIENSSELQEKRKMQNKIEEVRPVSIRTKKDVVVDASQPNAYDNYLNNFLPAARDRDVRCSKIADKIFKDPSYIDVEDPFYKNPMNVIERLHDVYTGTLVRTEVIAAYVSLSNIVKNDQYKGTKLTPKEYRNQMGLLEYYCRPEMSLRFIETVMEANMRYKFSPQMKKDIFEMSLSMLDSVIGQMFTTTNLIYGLGFFKLLIDNKILPKVVSEEIVPLFEKVLEHHKNFTNTWQNELEANEKISQWKLLREDLGRRSELGTEFRELLIQLKSRYQVTGE